MAEGDLIRPAAQVTYTATPDDLIAAGRSIPLRGTVVSFDQDAGLGTIRNPGGRCIEFHCTAISDGSRQIDAGADVAYVIGPGFQGDWVAVAVTPLVQSGSPGRSG